MLKEISLICGGIAALLLVLGLAGKNDMTAQASAERHAARMAADFARKDGGRAEMELRELVIAAKGGRK